MCPFTPRPKPDPLGELTAREREILALIARGGSNAALCSELHLSPKTVEAHVRSIYRKLGLGECPDSHRRVNAVLLYLQALDDRTDAA